MTRRYAVLLSSLAAMALAGLGAGSASAATCSDVLSYGNTCASGGNNVGVGDILSAGLESGTSAAFDASGLSVTCSTLSFNDQVQTNPTAPGSSSGSFTSLTVSGCTSNLGAVSATVLSKPSLTVSSSDVGTLSGLEITFGAAGTSCTFDASSVTGTWSNTNSSLKFSKVPATVSGGGLCGSSGTESYTFGPVLDAAHSSARVYVNS